MKKETVAMIIESLISEQSKRFSEHEIALKIRNWHTILEDVTEEQAMAGLRKCLELAGEFMPSIGKFNEACLSGSGCSSLEDQAAEAWALIMANISAWGSLVFKDTAIAETLRKMGGRNMLSNMLITEEPFRKRDFIALYLTMKRKKQEFSPILSDKYVKDYKFLGYDESDDLQKVVVQIEEQKGLEHKIAAMTRKLNLRWLRTNNEKIQFHRKCS